MIPVIFVILSWPAVFTFLDKVKVALVPPFKLMLASIADPVVVVAFTIPSNLMD